MFAGDCRCLSGTARVGLLYQHLMGIWTLKIPTPNTSSPLLFRHGFLEVVSYLVEDGASINDVDGEGMNCLHHASESGEHEVLEYLLQLEQTAIIIDSTDNSKVPFR